MKRFPGSLMSRAFTAALLAGLLGAPAYADKLVYSDLEKDGSVTQLYLADDGHVWCLFISADGKTYTVFDPSSDSNPDDTSTGAGSHSDKPDIEDLIKHGADIHVKVAPADSPDLLAHLEGSIGGDNGPAPHWNPGDDDNGHGPGTPPDHGDDNKKTPDEIRAEIATANEIARAFANLRDSMGSGEEGGTESWGGPNTKGGPGGNNDRNKTNDDDEDGTGNEAKNDTLGDTMSLGPKPEFVNPPISDRTGSTGGGAGHAGADHASAASGGGGGGRSLR